MIEEQNDNAPVIGIERELRKAYLEYSLSVIIGRAIPDARDGLKPVHRRIMYAMHELGNAYNRPHKKSARVVGDVIGKYHPHGDSAVYDALVRMAQDFSMRDPLVDGQGNFGSIDGDSAAAMRYTEVRMSRLAGEFMEDIDKETVEFRPNYDNTLREPSVMPTRVPNLLLNGSSGIAVGMATNIPPHNLGELCEALIHLLDHPGCTPLDLMEFVKGPDFPTAGAVYAGQGLIDAYATGRGTVKVRGRVELEEKKKVQSIVIREIPFALNKSSLVEKIANLVNEHKIDGVSDLRDESDRNGIRIVLDLKRGAIPDIVINALYKFTPLESSFGINMLAVAGNKPQLLNLKSALAIFLEHRREVIIRRTRHDLARAEARAHILDGLRKALDHIDEVIRVIRASKTPPEAKEALVARFGFTEPQAQAILDMRLQRLTNLEQEKLLEEYAELLKRIEFFKSVLADVEVLKSVVRGEIESLSATFATGRRTEVLEEELDGIEIEDLIPDEDVVITLSRRGYVKRTTLSNYQQQRRGGKGIAGLHTADDDSVREFLTTTNHQHLLLFTNQGRMHRLKVHRVPEGSRTGKGVHIANLLPLEKDETISTALTVREFAEDSFFLFVTRRGMVKRASAALYARVRKGGILAVGLRPDDALITVREVQDSQQVVLVTAGGLAIRFACRDVRPMGRGAAGVKGIALRSDDEVVACVIVDGGTPSPGPDQAELPFDPADSAEPVEMPEPAETDDSGAAENGRAEPGEAIMTVSANGYGKRTLINLYRLQSRGGRGVINFRVTAKSGPVIGALPVTDDDVLVLLTSTNKILRMNLEEVRNLGRATQGVRLVRLDEGATLIAFDRIDEHVAQEDE